MTLSKDQGALKPFPVQREIFDCATQAQVREEVYMRAYEVYVHKYGPQQALIENGCRGGFSKGELIAFLYARTFVKSEWNARVDEAFAGMVP